MVALADVRRWDTAALEGVLRTVGAARDGLLDRDADLTTARPPVDWYGTTADVARAEHERLAERLRRVVAGVATLRSGVAGAADAVAALRRDLAAAEALAVERGFTIAADGTVTDARPVVLPVDQIAAHQARRAAEQAGIVEQLEAVLRRAAGIDEALAELIVRAATEQVDDGTGATLAGATAGLDRRAALFRSLTGRDPVTEQDLRVAAALDAQSTEPPAQLAVARITPVPGAGLVHGGAFIAGREVTSGPPEWTNLGDDRGFDPAAGPERSRMAFLVDYENGLVIVRQNPSRSVDGTAETGTPRVGVEQDTSGAVRMRMWGADPLTLPFTDRLGWSVRGELVVDPRGGPHGSAAVNGVVGQYPSWEAYHSAPGQEPTTVLERRQNGPLPAWLPPVLPDEMGPSTNLPWPVQEVGQHPERLGQWHREHHPDQTAGAVLGEVWDTINPVPLVDEFDDLLDESFHDYPMPALPAPTPDGSGGIEVPVAPVVGR